MSDSITIARPYAKAIFEHARTIGKLREWSDYLHVLALSIMDANVQNFITNPATTAEQHSELLISIVPNAKNDDTSHLKNLVETLAQNKRTLILPDIMTLFDAMRAEQEKTLSVNVSSYSELTAQQEQELINSLSERLQRKVTLNIAIDKELIGGAVINAGDLVIDGSVRGKLDKLRTGLAA
ncbi:MAG: F0F1 ATP synthase subunit delta [Legionella sp.]|nr:F0F1 ATP synthase subunit delta [Legionella sp.]